MHTHVILDLGLQYTKMQVKLPTAQNVSKSGSVNRLKNLIRIKCCPHNRIAIRTSTENTQRSCSHF